MITENITMSTFLGPSSTADEVLAGLDLGGKRVLVTGVSSGLGVETARVLVAHGAHVVGAARDLVKAEAATGPSGTLSRMAADSSWLRLISLLWQAFGL